MTPSPFAGLATPALHVEGKAPGGVAVLLGLGQLGEEIAHQIEDLGVGGGIAARRSSNRRLIDVDDLVDVLEAGDLVVSAHRDFTLVQRSRGCRVEDVIDQSALSRSRHAGDADQFPEREGGGDVLEIVLPGPHDLNGQAVPGPPRLRRFDAQRALEVLAGDALRIRLDHLGRALGHDLAAMPPRPGAEVDQPVGLLHGLAVVLHHHHAVADVAQSLQGFEQLAVVALMQADRRLVEDVDDAGEFAADLAGQTDPLAFAARERRCGAVQGQVGEAHIDEEAQPVSDLLQKLHRDRGFRPLELQAFEKREGVAHRQRGEVRDGDSVDLHGQRLAAHATALAGRTRALREKALVVLAHVLRLRLLHPAQHRTQQTLVAHAERAAAPRALELDGHPFAAGAEEQNVLVRLREGLPGLVEVDAALLRKRAHDVRAPARGVVEFAPGLHRALR